jgi:uncharacterized protein YdhG (YjbR/CyaY superfamily)
MAPSKPTSDGMPTPTRRHGNDLQLPYKYNQKPLLAFLAAKHHLSIFPFSSQVVDAMRDRLAAFELSKGTIRFTAATPLPDEVVRDIVRYRIQEIAGRAR